MVTFGDFLPLEGSPKEDPKEEGDGKEEDGGEEDETDCIPEARVHETSGMQSSD